MGTSSLRFHPDRVSAGSGGQLAEPPASSGRQDLSEALRLTAQGDQAAFKSVYAATSVKLFGIVLRILGRQDAAEDVLQQTYIQVWERAGRVDPAASSPFEWLVSVARNCALDETRRGPTRPLAECPDLLQALNDTGTLVDPDRIGDHVRLQACLDGLGPDKREVLALAYHYGMTRDEIAAATNRPAATVKVWLRESLAQIKDCLGR